MLKDRIAKIAAAPKIVAQKAQNAVVQKADEVKTTVDQTVRNTLVSALNVGETAAWKIADALHDRSKSVAPSKK